MTCTHVVTFAAGALLASLVAWAVSPASATVEYQIVPTKVWTEQAEAGLNAEVAARRSDFADDAAAMTAIRDELLLRWIQARSEEGWVVVGPIDARVSTERSTVRGREDSDSGDSISGLLLRREDRKAALVPRFLPRDTANEMVRAALKKADEIELVQGAWERRQEAARAAVAGALAVPVEHVGLIPPGEGWRRPDGRVVLYELSVGRPRRTR